MKLTRQEEQELLFNKLKSLRDKRILSFCGIFAGLVQNDTKISKDELKEAIQEFKKQKTLTIADFNDSIEEIDELVQDVVKFASKYMID